MTEPKTVEVVPEASKEGVQETLFPVPARKARKKESRQRSCHLMARVSPQEKRQITRTARDVKMSVSEYVRYLLLLDQRARQQART